MFRKLFKSLTAESMFSKTYRELSALSDKELRDIGLHRGDIYTVAKDAERMAAKEEVAKKHSGYRLFEVHP